MKRHCLLPAMVLLLSLQACGRRAEPVGDAAQAALSTGPLEPVVQKAVSLLQSGTAERLEILYLPKEVATRGSVDPAYLGRACFYRIWIERLDQSPLRSELATTLASSGITLTPSDSDLRWGLIFYDAAGARVLTIYLDKFGRRGLIDGQTFTSNDELDALLERRCSSLWAPSPKP
ncbi:MAG: hypothetical protein ACE149_19465 [Armatimonadota bacterium]